MNRSTVIISVVISIVLGLFSLPASAVVNSPVVRCVTINIDGSVSITFETPLDPNGEFQAYRLKSSNTLTPPNFTTSVVSNNYNQTVITDNSINFNLFSGVYYYILETLWDDGTGTQVSNSQDTLAVMYLSLSGLNTENPVLSWNPVSIPNLPTSLGVYYIYRQIGLTGTLQLIDSVNYGTFTYRDTLEICSDSVFYRVEIYDITGCASKTNVNAGPFKKTTVPFGPQLTCIGYDTSLANAGNVIMQWSPSASLETVAYGVYYNVNTPFDTVFGYTNTSLSFPYPPGATNFSLSSIDSCGIESNSGTTQKPMALNSIQNTCGRGILLNWTTYKSWGQPAAGYNVYVSENGGDFNLLAELSSSDSSYEHNSTVSNIVYCYFVEAVDPLNRCNPLSNVVCQTFVSNIQPDYIYLSSLYAISDSAMRVFGIFDSIPGVYAAQLERALDADGYFLPLQFIDSLQDSIVIFYDTTAKLSQTNYYYRYALYDTCMAFIGYSNVVKSILLELDLYNFEATLDWNFYEGWQEYFTGVQQYKLYRGYNGTFESSPIAVLKPNQFTLTDRVTNLYKSNGEICYYLVAFENLGNALGVKDSARSNVICHTIESNIFIPSAFTPNGDNRNELFKPVFSYIGITEYTFWVFNGLGQVIFETTDPTIGWDGTLNQYPVQGGIYTYRMKAKSESGGSYDLNGRVTVLR